MKRTARARCEVSDQPIHGDFLGWHHDYSDRRDLGVGSVQGDLCGKYRDCVVYDHAGNPIRFKQHPVGFRKH